MSVLSSPGGGARGPVPGPVRAAIRPHRRAIALAALCGLATGAADLGSSLAARRVIDGAVAGPGPVRASLAAVLALILGFAVMKTVARWGRRRVAERAGQAVARDLRVRLFAHVLRLPVGFFHEREVGKVLLRFVSDLTSVRRLVSRGLSDIAADGLAVAGLFAGMLAVDWRLALGLAGLGGAELVLIARVNGRLRALNRRVRDERARLSGLIEDALSGIEAIKAFRRARKETRRVRRRSQRIFEDSVAQASVGAWGEGVSEAIHGLATVYVLGAGGLLLAAGAVTPGTLVAFLLLFHHVFPPVRRLVLANEVVQTARVQSARIAALLDRPPEAAPSGRVAPGDGAVVAERVDGRLDFVAKRGEIVALLGESGAGKSTLAAYLLGFRRPAAGRLLVAGHDVSRTAPDDLRRLVAWAGAHAPLLRGSIAKNVRFGRPRASAAATEGAARASALDRVAGRFPRGLRHAVGSGGRRLSAGERALVALARALLVRRPVLVLDEPFRGLDPSTADVIWRTLEARRPTTTTLVLTADPAVAVRADRVVHLSASPRGAPAPGGALVSQS